METKLSIIIPHFSFCDEIDNLLIENVNHLLDNTKCLFDIVIICSGFRKKIDIEDDPRIKIINHKEQLGFPKACNTGLEYAKGDFICFLNNDVKVTDNWDLPCLEMFDRDPKMGIVTPDVWLQDNAKKWFSPRDNQQGSCIFIKRETLEFLEDPLMYDGVIIDKGCFGFDERFEPGYAEDTDLFLRVWIRKLKRRIAFDSKVYHCGGTSFRKVYKNIQKVAKKSRFSYEDKWKILGKECWLLWTRENFVDFSVKK